MRSDLTEACRAVRGLQTLQLSGAYHSNTARENVLDRATKESLWFHSAIIIQRLQCEMNKWNYKEFQVRVIFFFLKEEMAQRGRIK